MEANEIFNGMTKGDFFSSFERVYAGDNVIVCDMYLSTLTNEKSRTANAYAITTAVNGTYNIGIDPSKVGEMFKLLEEVSGCDEISFDLDERIKLLLTSAKLTP